MASRYTRTTHWFRGGEIVNADRAEEVAGFPQLRITGNEGDGLEIRVLHSEGFLANHLVVQHALPGKMAAREQRRRVLTKVLKGDNKTRTKL